MAAQLTRRIVRAEPDSYNRQDIDHLSDHFNVHFFGSVDIAVPRGREQAGLAPERGHRHYEVDAAYGATPYALQDAS